MATLESIHKGSESLQRNLCTEGDETLDHLLLDCKGLTIPPRQDHRVRRAGGSVG